MALTKVSQALGSTPSIDDNGTATAVTIDSSGNVGVGTASPTQKLEINNGSNTAAAIKVTDTSGYTELFFGDSADDDAGYISYRHATDHLSFGVNAAERMRIDSNGDVGIGLTSVSGVRLAVKQTAANSGGIWAYCSANDSQLRLYHNGSYAGIDATYSSTGAFAPIVFRTSEAERMRIDSAGKIQIGNNIPIWSGQYGGALFLKGDNSTSNRYAQLAIVDSTGSIVAAGLKIDTSGYMYNTSMLGSASANSDVRFNTSDGLIYYQTSSQRYKENIQDLPSVLDKVNALRPVTFDEIDTGNPCFGLIAEEVVEQIPELVNLREIEGYDEPQPDNIPYSMLSVYLLKAVQEQQAIIDDLKARIETLEGA